jgi:Insertion element 4 transposase N-terminal
MRLHVSKHRGALGYSVERWEPPTKGAVTQARQWFGAEPMAELFSQVAVPPADLDTEGAFLGPWVRVGGRFL